MAANKAAIALSLEGGSDLTDTINPRLVSLSLTEKREAEADELEIRLQNTDGLLAIPKPGALLNLSIGWESGDTVPLGLVEKGQFKVDEVGQEGPPDIVHIKARSADLTGLLRQRRTKTWRDTNLGSVLGQIAARHDRTARIGSDLASLPIDAIEQEGKSDMAFVADLGRRYDAIATWKNGFLLFLPIGNSASASGAPMATGTFTKADGLRWTFNQADRENYDGAEAQWLDQNAARRRTVRVGGDNRRKLKRVYATEAEARQAAQAATSRAAREPYRFTFELAIGDPALQPDAPVSLSGWGETIDGLEWLVESVRTDFDGRGLLQSIEMETAG